LELEENENRKDLTVGERKKTFNVAKKNVATSVKATERILPTLSVKRGRTAKKSVTQKERAAVLGGSQQSLSRDGQHVEIAEQFPFL